MILYNKFILVIVQVYLVYCQPASQNDKTHNTLSYYNYLILHGSYKS